MNLNIKSKKVELIFTTKKIVNLTKDIKEKNLEDLYFKIMNEKNIEALVDLIYAFAEDRDTGLNSFNNIDEVYDFIDDYMKENQKTYDDIFNEIAEAINEEGFFKTKMTKEEMQEKMNNPLLSLNMDEVIKTSAEKAMATVVSAEFDKEEKKENKA